MAKQIKAINCPNRGSVQQSQIKEDHYLCANCGTDYILILDGDDITFNFRHQHNGGLFSRALAGLSKNLH